MRRPIRFLTSSIASLAVLAAGLPHRAAAQPRTTSVPDTSPVVPLETRWPRTFAMEVFAAQQRNPTAIEATGDGWVLITPLQEWPSAADRRPTHHVRVRPVDVARWVEVIRARLAAGADSGSENHDPRLPPLGRGRARFDVHVAPSSQGGRVSFALVDCDGVHGLYGVSRPELLRIADRVERAARAAAVQSPRPVPPTLDRPYYASEVSCAAAPLPGNAVPRISRPRSAAERRYREVGVRFVVDTTGVVEPGSIAFLPGTPSAHARAARAVVGGWRFRPAEWGSAPVRQIVTSVLVFDPTRPAVLPRIPPEEISRSGRSSVRADGRSVHVRFGAWRPDGSFFGSQEWLTPDSVDAWVARGRAYVKAVVVNRAAPPSLPSMTERLGPAEEGNQLILGPPFDGTPATMRAASHGMQGCSMETLQPMPFDRRMFAVFTGAARRARDARPPTRTSATDRVYWSGEVACPARLPGTARSLPDAPRIWRHPMAIYPQSLDSLRARAEVMASVDVDTMGVPRRASLRVMPGSDPRAVAALRATIDRHRFTPAVRGGVKVPARVLRTWLFAPPSVCDDEDAGIDCPREYRRGP